jgi:sulfane dehydrogenase subunit SoxC
MGLEEKDRGPAEERPEHDADPRVSRRGLFQMAGAAGGAAAFGIAGPAGGGEAVAAQATESTPAAGATPEASSALPPDVPPWMTKWGPLPSEYGERSPFEEGVVRVPNSDTSPAWSFTPLQDLHGTMTPNSLFFERHHAGIPEIDPAQHRLMVHGMVARPLIFTMDDIKRFPAKSVIHFLECSGNSLYEWAEEGIPDTVQVGFGLVSQTEWTGVPLKTVLNEVGIDPKATWLLAEGADAAGMTRSVPVEKAMDDALLAYAMNGEALRPAHGYPLRLLLPGWEGNASIKWLRRIEVGDQPWETREETSKYTDLMPDGTARQFTFAMEAKSVITSPSGGQRIASPGFVEISGIAWSGSGRITRVDVSTDGGETWQEAALQDPVLPVALTRFRLPWTWDGKPARLQSRAIDETGYVQPTVQQLVEVRGVNSTYHMNGIKTWAVDANGEVTSAYG